VLVDVVHRPCDDRVVSDGIAVTKREVGRGATVPDGNAQFVFHAGNLELSSTSYQWLVVAGSTAKFNWAGTVNGVDGYTFQINADDGSPDQFRMQIWGPGSGIVYDNGSDQNIGGGSIIVHS
jgi:hypothetical protein